MSNIVKFLLPIIIVSILPVACRRTNTQTEEMIFNDGIIFVSDKDNKFKYYSMTPDGKNIQILNLGNFPENTVIDELHWVPEWKKFIITATTGSDSEIYTVEQGGYNLLNLTKTPTVFETSPVVSPNGKFIAFVGLDLDLDIMIMKSNGNERKNITHHPARDSAPAWSQDNRIIFSSNRNGTPNIYSINVADNNLTNISKGPGLDSTFSLSPDGHKLVFDSDRSGNMDLFIVDINGENLFNLTNSPSREVEPIWSPDGRKIAFRSDQDGSWDIFIINVDGSGIKNLTHTLSIDEYGISWSPDSQYIVYYAKVNGQSDIFKVSIEGDVPINLTKSTYNEISPIWVNFQ